MFERYTESARRALFFARYEVTQHGGSSIDTEHLLLGLIRGGTPTLDPIFAASKVSPTALRREIEQRLATAERVPTPVEIPFGADAKRALELAAREADDLKHGYIGPEHLLLGLLRLEKSVAGAVLIGRGIALNDVREAAAKLPAPSSADGAMTDHGFGYGVELDIGGILTRIGRIEEMVGQLAQRAGDAQATIELAHAISEELAALKDPLERLE
jgi:ATP-dependent Clp protease ATP-binding subunit ClpA